MKTSKRAKRMQRHYRRAKTVPAFNIISLMDIFTILVFFLLVHSSEVEVLPSAKGIDLPESVAETKPRESVVVMVTDQDIILDGKHIVSVQEVAQENGKDIALLKQALKVVVDESSAESKIEQAREITIMGDKAVPYKLLKKVMLSCTRAGFNKISLSVLQKSRQQG